MAQGRILSTFGYVSNYISHRVDGEEVCFQFAFDVFFYVAHELDNNPDCEIKGIYEAPLLGDNKVMIDDLLNKDNPSFKTLIEEFKENLDYCLDLPFREMAMNLEDRFEGEQWNAERLLHACTSIVLYGCYAKSEGCKGSMFNAFKYITNFIASTALSPLAHASIRKMFPDLKTSNVEHKDFYFHFALEVVFYVANELQKIDCDLKDIHLPSLSEAYVVFIDRLLDTRSERFEFLMAEFEENPDYCLDLPFKDVAKNLEKGFEGQQWNAARLLHTCINIAIFGCYAERKDHQGAMFNAIEHITGFIAREFGSSFVHASTKKLFNEVFQGFKKSITAKPPVYVTLNKNNLRT